MSHRAFVSSTYEDLKEHRAHVIRELRGAGVDVDPMEDWAADARPPQRFSTERLEGCDLCVLLVALRRGHVPAGESRSITQLEFDAACERGIEPLVFLLDEQAPWPRRFDELDSDPEMRRWRTALEESYGVGYFTNEPNSVEIAPALTRWVSRRSAPRRVESPPPMASYRPAESAAPPRWQPRDLAVVISTTTLSLCLLIVVVGTMIGVAGGAVPLEYLGGIQGAGIVGGLATLGTILHRIVRTTLRTSDER